MEIAVKNYRCFPDSSPASLMIRNGFTAFLRPNSPGKSSLLRFFHDFRSLFPQLSTPATLTAALTAKGQAFNLPQRVPDFETLFYDQNHRDLSIEVRFTPSNNASSAPQYNHLQKLLVILPRSRNVFRAHIYQAAHRLNCANAAMDKSVLLHR